MKKKNIDDFIRESKLIHGNKYDYSLCEYKKNNIKTKIICPIHGVFEQMPLKHINGKQGCPKCGDIKTHEKQRKNKNDFIGESILIHNNKYDYSLVNYINNKTNIKIICPTHGEFEQTPSNHLKGKGCKYCGGTTKIDKLVFINKANLIHGNKYDYSLVNYINSQTPIKIICPTHGEFEQLPNNHLSKEQGCYECLNKVFNMETFTKKAKLIHGDSYNYSKTNYTKSNEKTIIICKKHGEFEQSPNSHLQGQGCPSCGHINSKKEKEIISFLDKIKIKSINNSRNIINPLELDIYIPSHNLAIEFNGLVWHSELHKPSNYHLNKTELCEKNGIKLIHIFEDEWDFKKDIVKSRLSSIFGLNKNKIYARKCIIKEVNSKESKIFLEQNHIQGNVNSRVKLGLYYNTELVSLMTFGGLRKTTGLIHKNNVYELVRFCNKLNTTVIGGADKLLKHFIKIYNPKEIISYADRRWSQGDLYEKLGFKFINNTTPNYYYIVDKNRKHRFNFRKDVLVKEGFDETKSEHDIMLERGIYRIYDCGNKKYSLTNSDLISAKFLEI